MRTLNFNQGYFMAIKISIVFHSMHGHCFSLAKELKEGAEQIPDVEVNIFRVPETNSPEVIEVMGAKEKIKLFSHIPIATKGNLVEADAILLGAPTYFGTPRLWRRFKLWLK